ncbi:uncharacterized protein I206_106158 [Kwoniella pini CBS 10737]|uniref:Uncharacterized protein n=1 Tax=Kwoniella pini CBS 10737 TaxID=1296096 RepID=A0A1B9I194_9TREE|nr:uncharacterized protein I206_04983 [Kwoniella pini CBS 10737]OCF49294.1 hypothetical protein I206_04983 [Kwoniella pini CBS 10737]
MSSESGISNIQPSITEDMSMDGKFDEMFGYNTYVLNRWRDPTDIPEDVQAALQKNNSSIIIDEVSETAHRKGMKRQWQEQMEKFRSAGILGTNLAESSSDQTFDGFAGEPLS